MDIIVVQLRGQCSECGVSLPGQATICSFCRAMAGGPGRARARLCNRRR